MVEDGQIRSLLNDAANDIKNLTNIAIDSGEISRRRVEELAERRKEIEEIIPNLEEHGVEHSFQVGESALDMNKPSRPTRKKLVTVIELTHTSANNFRVDEEGRTVSDTGCSPNSPVVVGVYSNLDTDERFFFPESRLRKI